MKHFIMHFKKFFTSAVSHIRKGMADEESSEIADPLE
jgi:hypothetical protein